MIGAACAQRCRDAVSPAVQEPLASPRRLPAHRAGCGLPEGIDPGVENAQVWSRGQFAAPEHLGRVAVHSEPRVPGDGGRHLTCRQGEGDGRISHLAGDEQRDPGRAQPDRCHLILSRGQLDVHVGPVARTDDLDLDPELGGGPEQVRTGGPARLGPRLRLLTIRPALLPAGLALLLAGTSPAGQRDTSEGTQ